jgi:hypothetical protein
MTPRMFFGGKLYPDDVSLEAADEVAPLAEVPADCARLKEEKLLATNAPDRRKASAFRPGILPPICASKLLSLGIRAEVV